jgi:methionyl-tRNA synthetase
MSKNFYITTTLPYVNNDPHIGFALEIVRADTIARYKMLKGYEVFFNTGTDEHGQKLFVSAEKAGVDVKDYVDEYAGKFRELVKPLGILDEVHFIRTTDEKHVQAAQEFWKRCDKNGYIEKRTYQSKYCVGCELEKTDSELVEGECPVHPGQQLELRNEENYFFKFSAFTEKLLALYASTPDFVVPDFRFNEIRAFVERGLQDFSISRLKEKMPWGVPVPGDTDHVMYVWFDALVNYISTLDWPSYSEDSNDKPSFENNLFNKFWVNGTPVQYCGKDNLRQQSAMWQAMLLSVDLPPSRQIVINGFVNVGGQKMSKSLGNVVNPLTLIEAYGTDALRYYCLRELHPFEDSDYTDEKFKNAYNGNLANGLGNLLSRVLKMTETYFGGNISDKSDAVLPMRFQLPGGDESSEGMSLHYFIKQTVLPEYERAFSAYEINRALDSVWALIQKLDEYITEYEPFKLIKTDKDKTEGVLWNTLVGLHYISTLLAPALPETSKIIKEHIGANLIEGEPKTFKTKPLEKPLFMRKD